MSSFKITVEENGLEGQPAGSIALDCAGNGRFLEAIGILKDDSKRTVIKKIRGAIAALEGRAPYDSSLVTRLHKCEEDVDLSGEQSEENFQDQGNSDRYIRELEDENERIADAGIEPEHEIEYFADELKKLLDWMLK